MAGEDRGYPALNKPDTIKHLATVLKENDIDGN